ncbi:MAG: hypothetical protein Q4D16_18765 [Eubacteriales bacterium]|nr:hypothetical protein [Eubacteriales bacterium]
MKKTELLLFNNVSVGIEQSMALHNLSMVIFQEEITGILYENSVSGEALLKLLSGNGEVKNGTVSYCRKKLTDLKYLKKQHSIIGPVPNVIHTLSIIDNVFFSQYSLCIMRKRVYQTKLQKLYYLFDIHIPFQKTVEELSVVERVQIELLAAYISKKKYVILSQFSSMFSADEMELLVPVIMKLHMLGTAVIVVDSYERFIYRITDKAYIMKNGTAVDFLSGESLNEYAVTKAFCPYVSPGSDRLGQDKLYEEMQVSGKAVLSADQVETKLLKKLNFVLREGQILKVCYTDRKLAEDFAGLFTGQTALKSGNMVWKGPESSQGKPRVGVVYADSVHKVLYPDHTVEFNLLYPVMTKTSRLFWSEKYLKHMKQLLAEELPEEIYGKKVRDIDDTSKLSLVCAKWYLYRPDILLYVKPFPSFYYEGDKLTEKWMKKIAARGTGVIALESNWPSYIEISGIAKNLDHYAK